MRFPRVPPWIFQTLAVAFTPSWGGTGSERRLARSRRQSTSAGYRGSPVELLEFRALLTFDLGDAPLPYPTTLAENGARHNDAGPMLGATRDNEVDGSHSANADADGADEDGVAFGVIQAGALDAAVTVVVRTEGAPTAAKLDAWVDFNGDGNWGGTGEQIFSSQTVLAGANHLTFSVPSWARDGKTFARFRLSTAGQPGPKGLAANGEVEDYAVTINPPAVASGIFGMQNIVASRAIGATSMFAADLDGDGDMDMLSASLNDNTIAWYENDGGQNFTAHTISTAPDGATSVFAADVDGDGDLDVLSASLNDDSIRWYENDGSEHFIARTISTLADGASSVFAADVDGDGDTDVLSASLYDSRIVWYQNNGSQNFTTRTIGIAEGATSVIAGDVDGDGDLDVLSASRLDSRIAWYENDGLQNFTSHTISASAIFAVSVTAADVDGDGDLDVISASRADRKIAWYENDGGGNFTARTISTAADGANCVFAADLDGDGDVDILSAASTGSQIAWYENSGTQTFTSHLISTETHLASSVFAADVDGDGDLDVISAASFDNRISWFENLDSDFGDAPAAYPTTEAEDGARHKAVGPTLGTMRDPDADGTHSANATGDGTDEDGVTVGAMQVGALGVTATVTVSGAPRGAKLDAWIDFNGDGSWAGAGERIAASRAVINGVNTITFDVPVGAKAGKTFARFRLSTTGNLGPGGAAADGEVEDYAVMIVLPAPIITGPFAVTPEQRPAITWTPAPGADRYEIWIRNQSTGVNAFLRTTVSSTEFRPGSDLGIGLFNLWIRSGNSAGVFSEWTPQYNFRINSAAIFDTVQRYQSATRPTLSWIPLTGAANYDLWIDNVSTGQQQAVRNGSLTGAVWTSPTDLPMGQYRAWIRGLDTAGQAAQWSIAADFFVLPPVSVIGPMNATFDLTPTFRWNAVAGAVGYDLTLRDANTGVVVSNPRNIVGTSFTPSANLLSGPYRWQVVAVAAGGYRSQSATTQDLFVGGRPTLLSPAGNTPDTTPTFNWTAVEGAAAYELFVTRIDIPVSGIINLTGLTGTSYTPATPLSIGTYRTWIRAVSATAQISPWSILVSFSVTAVTEDSDVPAGDPLWTGLAILEKKDAQNGLPELSSAATSAAVQPGESLFFGDGPDDISKAAGSHRAVPRVTRPTETRSSMQFSRPCFGIFDEKLTLAVMADLSTSGFLLDL